MNNHEDHYLKTPIMKIKLGEILISESGIPSLKVKKPGSGIYEIVPMSTLQKLLIDKIEKMRR